MRRVTNGETHVHQIFPDPEQWKRCNLRSLLQRDDEPDERNRNLPERSAEKHHRGAEWSEDEMSRFVNWKKREHSELAQQEGPVLTRVVLNECFCRLIKIIAAKRVDDEFERERRVTLDRIKGLGS